MSFRIQSIISRLFGIIVCYFLFTFPANGLLFSMNHMDQLLGQNALAVGCASVLLVLLGGLLCWIISSKAFSTTSDRTFLIVVSLLTAGLYCFGVTRYTYAPTNDFLLMHQVAERMTKLSFIDNLRHLDGITAERMLFYLYPFYRIFGPKLFLVKYFNVALVLASGYFLYRICRIAHPDPRLARVTLIAYYLIPNRFYYLIVPTHDVVAQFYLALFLLIYINLFRSITQARILILILKSLALAAVAFMLSMTRTIYLILFLTAFMIIVVKLAGEVMKLSRQEWPRQLLNMAKTVLFTFVLPFSLCRIGIHILGSATEAFSGFKVIFCANASFEHGAWIEIMAKAPYMKLLPQTDSGQLYGVGRILSELYYNFDGYIIMLLRKGRILYQVGYDMEYGSPWKFHTFTFFLINAQRAILFVLIMVGLVWIAAHRLNIAYLTMLAFAFIFNYLLMFSEVQVRYSTIMYPYFAFAAGQGVLALLHRREDAEQASGLDRQRWPALNPVIASTLLLLLVFVGRPLYARAMNGSSRLFQCLSHPTVKVPKNTVNPNRLLVEINPPQLRPFSYGLQLPAGHAGGVVAAWEFPVKAGRSYRLKFFLRTQSSQRDSAEVTVKAGAGVVHTRRSPAGDHLEFIDTKPIRAEKDRLPVSLLLTRPPGVSGPALAPAQAIVEYAMLEPAR